MRVLKKHAHEKQEKNILFWRETREDRSSCCSCRLQKRYARQQESSCKLLGPPTKTTKKNVTNIDGKHAKMRNIGKKRRNNQRRKLTRQKSLHKKITSTNTHQLIDEADPVAEDVRVRVAAAVGVEVRHASVRLLSRDEVSVLAADGQPRGRGVLADLVTDVRARLPGPHHQNALALELLTITKIRTKGVHGRWGRWRRGEGNRT